MKSLITILGILTINISISAAQSFQDSFLGEDFMLYKGTLLKINEGAISGLNFSFYSDLKDCQEMYSDNVIYPDTAYKFKTAKDSLMNRVFLVENIVGKNGETFIGNSNFEKPIFVLKDNQTQQVIYYKYEQENELNFPFLVSGMVLDTEVLCAKIIRRVDDFTDEVTINTPLSEGLTLSSMVFYKVTEDSKTVYYLSLRAYGSTVNVGEAGVIILFDDGTKMNKPSEEIDVEADERGFEYSAFIRLSESDVNILKAKKITKYRLYIYDNTVNQGEADKFKEYVKCVFSRK